MQTEIDFLPPRCREQWARRRAVYYRAGVVAAFAALLTLGAWYQGRRASRVEQEFVRTQNLHEQVQTQRQQLAAIEGELHTARWQAELLTFLRHPARPSVLIAAALEPLPESVTVRSIEIRYEPVEGRPQPVVQPGAPAPQPIDPATLTPSERDLRQLSALHARSRRVVHVSGITQSAVELHKFLGKLGSSPTFTAAELVSLEAREKGSAGNASEFHLRLVVRESGAGPAGGASAAARVAQRN